MLGFSLSPVAGGGAAAPLAAFFGKGGGTAVAVEPASGGDLIVWSDLGHGHAARITLDNDDPSLRLSWRETLLAKLRAVYPVGEMALVGSWTQMQSSGSGLAASYTGNRAVSTSAGNAQAVISLGRAAPYDLWVHYTARTNGGYLRVQIDGGDALVNEIGDPAGLGFKAFPTYSATDLQRRQVVRVASGLSGAHEVTLSFGGPATPGGGAVMVEAVSISAALSDARVQPPLWAAGTAYAMGDEVRWNGVFYAARATGTSGTTPPAHVSGIASDGGLEWRADNRPTYPEFVAIDYASEREYAMRFATGGVTSEAGGQTHGNEPLLGRVIMLDGQAWDAAQGFAVGAELRIGETTRWQDDSGTVIADCQLDRRVTPGEIRHDVTVTGAGPLADVEWLYAGMLPMVHWDGESGSTVIAQVHGAGGTTVALADHAGLVAPNIGFGGARSLALSGEIGASALRYGLEVALSAAAVAGPEGLTAFLRPNIDGRMASGSLDWPAKAYIAAHKDGGFQIAGGDVIAFSSRHVISAR